MSLNINHSGSRNHSRNPSPMVPPTSILKKAVIPPPNNSAQNSVTINMSKNETKSTSFKCCWCMDILKEPIQLSSTCSHYGCARCINLLLNFEKLKRCCDKLEGEEPEIVENRKPYEIPCPCCPNRLSLSYDKVHSDPSVFEQNQEGYYSTFNSARSDGFGGEKINPYLFTLIDEEFKSLADEYGNTELEGRMCANCETTLATCQCETCKFILCGECFASIHDQKLLSSHKKADLRPGNYIPINGKCMKHGKDLDLFCMNDNEKVCSLCAISETHKNHQCIPVNEHISHLHDDLRVQAEHLFADDDSAIHNEISNITSFLQHANDYYVQSKNFIEENFGKIEAALKKRKEDLLNTALKTYKNPNMEEKVKLLKTFSFSGWRDSIARFSRKLNEEDKINQTSKRLEFIENHLTIDHMLNSGDIIPGNNLESSQEDNAYSRSQTPMLEDGIVSDIINMIEMITISKDEHAQNQENIKHDKKFKSIIGDMMHQNENSIRKSISITCLSSKKRLGSTQ